MTLRQEPVDSPFPFSQANLVGDSAVAVDFGETISPEIHSRVLTLDRAILAAPEELGIIEAVPTYRSLLIHYDPEATEPTRLLKELFKIHSSQNTSSQNTSSHDTSSHNTESDSKARAPRTWQVPVCYGGAYGPDLGAIAKIHGLTEPQVISLHTAPWYRVYMIGFAPGYTYLGGLQEALHTPRLETPRLKIDPGCVSIGGQQTLTGAASMPSGWHLLGRTPVRSFDLDRDDPCLFRAGDRVRFVAVRHEFFQPLEHRALHGDPVAELLEAETLPTDPEKTP